MALVIGAGACGEARPDAPPTPSFGSPSASPSIIPGTLRVPDVRFNRLDLARIQVKRAGLRLKVADRKETLSFFPDTVLSQKPKPNAEADRDSLVKVTVSFAPDCHPSYPTVCIPPFKQNVTCDTLFPTRNFTVEPPDPYSLDPDNDGVGCERAR